MAKPGGVNLLNRKYFYGKDYNPVEHHLNQVGLQPHSPTLSTTYAGRLLCRHKHFQLHVMGSSIVPMMEIIIRDETFTEAQNLLPQRFCNI